MKKDQRSVDGLAPTCERSDEDVSILEVEGFRGRCHMEGRNKVLVGMAEKVLKSIKRQVEKMGFKLSNTEGRKEGKRKVIASCGYLEEIFKECSKKAGVELATSVETLGVELRTRTRQLGAKTEGEEEKSVK